MTKHDMLPFKMIVERGRLVPAEAYDAERLDTWRNGTKVNVTFVRDGGRVMERKWWGILNRAVKECKTPWKTANEASEAIKLAIGVVNLTKTVGGDFLAYPKSLTELEDPELDEAVEQMVNVVHRITGVDPEEWKKQVSHIRDEKSSDTPPDDNGSDDAPSPGDTVAADQSEPAEEADEEEDAPASEQEKPSNGSAVASSSEPISGMKRMLCEELVDNMLRDAFSEPAIERTAKLDKLRDVFLEAQNLGDMPAFVNLCHETARRVIGKAAERDRAREYLMGKIPEGGA